MNKPSKSKAETDQYKAKREIVCVGWDGQSKPILCYRDELDLPEHLRTHVENETSSFRIVS